MKKATLFLLCTALLAAVITGCGSGKKSEDAAEENTSGQVSDEASDHSGDETADHKEDLLSGLHHAEIEINDYGTISLELDADTAPVSVTNFVTLAKEGFYDGLTFHRIISGFMIQGGDPLGNGTGGSDTEIKGEFSSNGVENNIAHERGVISMARSQNPDSASSQFFIMHQDAPHLDGQYAAFGKVIEGMDVVNKIAGTATDYSDRPLEDQIMKSVTVDCFGVEYPEPETC